MQLRTSNELQLGKAGEYLVCADLITKGFVAFPSEQGLSYDVVLDNGSRLIKIQVKTTFEPRIVPQRNKESRCYIFNVKRKGRNNSKRYEDAEVDLFALVALDSRTIGYLANRDLKTTMNFRVDALRGSYYDEKGIQDFERAKVLKAEGKSIKEISEILGVHFSAAYRMTVDGFEPFESSARYLSDIERQPEWFLNI
jgi:hypothetical protein